MPDNDSTSSQNTDAATGSASGAAAAPSGDTLGIDLNAVKAAKAAALAMATLIEARLPHILSTRVRVELGLQGGSRTDSCGRLAADRDRSDGKRYGGGTTVGGERGGSRPIGRGTR